KDTILIGVRGEEGEVRGKYPELTDHFVPICYRHSDFVLNDLIPDH
ncbi:MAG: hypothetical protein ACI81W_003703, partial [Saprospiraceae bacterium]